LVIRFAEHLLPENLKPWYDLLVMNERVEKLMRRAAAEEARHARAAHITWPLCSSGKDLFFSLESSVTH